MFQPVRGTRDFLVDEMAHYRWVVGTARTVAECYNFDEISTPIFEFTKVFNRLGDTSDVVTKETYTFLDRGGESLSLRPEGTAPVVRAVVSNGLTQQVPLKFFYAGPMFRYDRPQKGRYRQFHQIGVELIGVEKPFADVETIAMGAQILEELGILSLTSLELNTLGDQESRDAYRKGLVTYLKDYQTQLSEESQKRLEKNPLRILDSKEARDKEIVASAPLYTDYLNSASQDFFGEVCEGLDHLKVNYKVNPRLVRGLDYYCHTAFEFVSKELGAQGAVLAGGRYDGLVKGMGGPDLPGVGWAGGIERMMLLSSLPNHAQQSRPVVVIPIGGAAEEIAVTVTQTLRQAGLRADLGYSGAAGKRMKRANKMNARWAVMLGEDELKANSATVRCLDSGDQTLVSLDKLGHFIKDQT